MPEQPPSLTWQLLAGVHLDARYRDAVINELYEHEERYSAPSYDVDTAAVLAEALDARRTALRWAAPMALLWIAGFLFAGWLFALYAAGCAALFGAAALRPVRRPAGRVTAGALRVLGGSVLVASAALAVATARTADWPEVTAAFGGPVLMAAVAGAHRAAVGRRLRFIDSAAYRGRAQPHRFNVIRALLHADQMSPLVVHREPTPFLGSGPVLDSLALAVEVRGATATFEVSDALERVARAVEAVPGLTTQVDECFLLPEEEVSPRSPSYPLPGLLPSSTRWLRIASRGLGSRLTTVFVQIRLDGPILFVQQVTCALPPVRREFTAADLPGARLVPLGTALAAPAALPAELAAWPLRRVRRLSSPPSGRPPSGPHASVRELAAEPDLPPLAAAEARRISRTVHLLVLDALRATLRDRGLSAPGLGEPQQESSRVFEGGIHIGNISPGAPARTGDITRHTSPGPTTNPDDDSWEDDLG
ncbi:hypothetical protein [Streptomyces sp. BPTC-684]|uniref:hypothetical protein n=1 Tax=Streptomyces sp. BPTC-684 TaxID=3043734 RepID=UPI0024B15179|nr:hypothetical protein [Streptomyces sp. BPTC-684]WHM36968.1 hypothetical protein QIY60_08730 [Streptomyces sp. BPTC-684]